jgi:hypothetical protein
MFSLVAMENDPAGGGAVLVAVGLAIAGLAALSWQRPRTSGTTLVAPWIWSCIVLLSLASGEVLIGLWGAPAPLWAADLRFAAAMSTFCPTVALLGAKRPQNRGWQAIVLSLWAILSLPSLEWLLYGGVAEIHPARFWFLVILIAGGALNGLGTRYWPSSLLYGAGQVALVWPFFFTELPPAGALAPLLGTSALVLAWLLAAAEWPRRTRVVLPLDRVWLDFRDAFGVAWSLRIAERMNASARIYDWPVRLGWRGFTAPLDRAMADVPPAAEESLRSLLRRFVSPAWIDARLVNSPRKSNVTAVVS